MHVNSERLCHSELSVLGAGGTSAPDFLLFLEFGALIASCSRHPPGYIPSSAREELTVPVLFGSIVG